MLRKWLDKLRGGAESEATRAENARAEEASQTDRVDRASSRVLGVHGDLGPTVPDAQTPDDRRPTD